MLKIQSSWWRKQTQILVLATFLLLWPKTAAALPLNSTKLPIADIIDKTHEATKNVAQKIYHRYFSNGTHFHFDDETCLLGTSRDYLSWLDDEGHVQQVLTVRKESSLDLSHRNWTEKEAQDWIEKRDDHSHRIEEVKVKKTSRGNFCSLANRYQHYDIISFAVIYMGTTHTHRRKNVFLIIKKKRCHITTEK